MSNLTAGPADEVALFATRRGMTKLPFQPEIVKTGDRPEAWTVEAIDLSGGEVYSASFFGPDAKDRADEYAAEKFAPEPSSKG
ncbi:MAG: hypothetical protein AB7H96_03875 [Vicinamibacterales bacterium]